MVNENGEGMTKEEEEEEREAQELRDWNAKNGTGSNGTSNGGEGGIKSKEEWLKVSKERREAQEALEGPINTHTNLDVCFLCAKPATSVCEVHTIFLGKWLRNAPHRRDPFQKANTITTRYAVWLPSVTTLSTKDCTDLSSFASPSWSRRGRGWAGLYPNAIIYLAGRFSMDLFI